MRRKEMTKNMPNEVTEVVSKYVGSNQQYDRNEDSREIGTGQLSATFGGPASCESIGSMSLRDGWGFIISMFSKEDGPSVKYD